mgnify:CR=1 FL=1
MKIANKEVIKFVEHLLKEDKAHQDITSNYFIDKGQQARATIFSKEKIIISGIDFTLELFKRNCGNIKVLLKLKDGSKIKNNTLSAIQAFNKASLVVCEGQAYDKSYENNYEINCCAQKYGNIKQ